MSIPPGAQLSIEFEYQGKLVKLKSSLEGSTLTVFYKEQEPFSMWEHDYMFYTWDEPESLSLNWPVQGGVGYRMEVSNE